MGYGMALNLLNNGFSLNVCANKNKKPIDNLIERGAIEFKSFNDLTKNSEIILMCVSNTRVALNIIENIKNNFKKNSTVIDLTTHEADGSIKIYKNLKKNNITYIESPVMGGPKQSEEGILGAIVGCEKEKFSFAKNILSNFCKNVIYFGEVGQASKAKLISNFLSLGTTTFVIESLKVAEKLNIDLKKLYEIAKLGSGNSGALHRIAENALNNNYKGYIFSVDNTVKDLTYINNLLKDMPDAEKLSSIIKNYYLEAQKNGYGDLLISELIKK